MYIELDYLGITMDNDFNILEEIEELVKAAHYWKDKDPKKYRQMLNKLKRQRKTPGHKERGYQEVLQAKRRERGGSGTKTNGGHSKNKMSTKTGNAVKRFQSSEKKAGTKLSPDRKNNSEGYGNGNVRHVPQHLNRGRHKVDEKKLKQWKSKLKKHDISTEDFVTLLRSKTLDAGNKELHNLLMWLDFDRFLNT